MGNPGVGGANISSATQSSLVNSSLVNSSLPHFSLLGSTPVPSTTSSNGSSDDNAAWGIDYDWKAKLIATCGVSVIILGTIFNGLIVVLKTRWENRHNADSVYKVALAIVDAANLYTGLLRYVIISISGFDLLDGSTATCLALCMHIHVFRYCAAWILVALNLERCMGVTRPMMKKRTGIQALGICVFVYIMCFSSQIFFFFVLERAKDERQHFRCRLKDTFRHGYATVFPFCNLLADCLAPIFIFFVTHIVIVSSMRKRDSTIGQYAMTHNVSFTNRPTIPIVTLPPGEDYPVTEDGTFYRGVTGMSMEDLPTSSVGLSRTASVSSRTSKKSGFHRETPILIRQSVSSFARHVRNRASTTVSTTTISHQKSTFHFLLLVDLAYLVLVLPRDAFLVVVTYEDTAIETWRHPTEGLTLAALNIIAFMNNALNFVYYMAGSKSFRNELSELFHGRSRRVPLCHPTPSTRSPRLTGVDTFQTGSPFAEARSSPRMVRMSLPNVIEEP